MSGSLCHIDIGIVLIWSRTATNEVAEQSIYRFVTNVRMPLTLSYIKQFTQCLPQVTHYFITELDYLHLNNSWLMKRFTRWHGSMHLLSKAREGQWTIIIFPLPFCVIYNVIMNLKKSLKLNEGFLNERFRDTYRKIELQ